MHSIGGRLLLGICFILMNYFFRIKMLRRSILFNVKVVVLNQITYIFDNQLRNLHVDKFQLLTAAIFETVVISDVLLADLKTFHFSFPVLVL